MKSIKKGQILDTESLEELLSRPTDSVISMMSRLSGDILFLGAGGKIGPSIARMAKRASDQAKTSRRIIAVSRFSNSAAEVHLQESGIETIRADLLNNQQLQDLPDVENIIYLAGLKFGATSKPALTWAMNVHLPSLVCQRYRNSKIVAFSSGNVYGLVPVDGGGSNEDDVLSPVGEYAMSCLGRERIFQHFSETLSIPTALLRLNYATEFRYGVLVDLARQVWENSTIDVSMGYVNIIWQGDANAMALAALADVTVPPKVINIAGPETLSIREVCQQFGQRMGKPVTFSGQEAETALLNDGTSAYVRYGTPQVSTLQMMDWITDWIKKGGETLGKPTHFQSRSGQF